MPHKKSIAISLGGSIVIPEEIDIKFLKKFKIYIESILPRYDKVFLVLGGGKTCRKYQQAASSLNKKNITNEDLDWIGIHTIYLNAFMVKTVFKEYAYEHIITNPNKKVKTNKKIIVAGAWKPGMSSDGDLVLIAKTFGLQEVINLSNISHIYDKDPSKYKDAKPYKNITWQQVQEIVGKKWIPGTNTPFDPTAVKFAKKLNLKVVILKGTDLANLKNYIDGKKFKGTVIE